MNAEQRDSRHLATELERRLAGLWWAVLRPSSEELSRTATSVLARLRDGGPQRITDLAGAEAVAQPTMTTLVGRLERLGLVERGAGDELQVWLLRRNGRLDRGVVGVVLGKRPLLHPRSYRLRTASP